LHNYEYALILIEKSRIFYKLELFDIFLTDLNEANEIIVEIFGYQSK
jgi:hypothetical protein